MSGRFFEPEPKRSGAGRWIAFALAIFLLAGVGGVAASFATGGSLFGPAPSRTPGGAIAGASGSGRPERHPGRPCCDAGSHRRRTRRVAVPIADPGRAHGPADGGRRRPGPAITGTVDPALSAKLQRALEKARKELALPGVAAAIILPDGSTWTGVSGYAVPAKKKLLQTNTPWAFASVTKTFTAALIMRLAEEGKLRSRRPALEVRSDLPGCEEADHRHAPSPDERAPGLLSGSPRRGARQAPHEGLDAAGGAGVSPRVLQHGRLPAGQGLVVLEYQLPPARPGRREGGRRHVGEPASTASSSIRWG